MHLTGEHSTMARYYSYVPSGVQLWLRGIIGKVLEGRCLSEEQNKVKMTSKPSDFLQWLIEGRHKSYEPVDVATMVGHCSTFLLEGFETSSSLMAFALYEVWHRSFIATRTRTLIHSYKKLCSTLIKRDENKYANLN